MGIEQMSLSSYWMTIRTKGVGHNGDTLEYSVSFSLTDEEIL
jgi:hypothetical protein